MQRRRFIQGAAVTSFLASQSGRAWALDADNAYRENIGVQLYTLRDQIAKDVKGTIQAVVDAGYKQGEPYGFPNCDPMLNAMKDAGLALNSTHFDWASVVTPSDEGMSDFKKIVEKAKEVGLSHLVVPYLQGEVRKTLDDYKSVAGKFNKAAEICKDAGIQLSYHNHSFEFAPMDDGKCGYDVFIEEFGDAMKFEMDVFWVKLGGHEPVELIKKLKGRVSQLHLKDLKKGSTIPNYNGVPKDAFKELGNGMIPMEPILLAAQEAGVVHCHVEQDQSPNPLLSIEESIGYLKKL